MKSLIYTCLLVFLLCEKSFSDEVSDKMNKKFERYIEFLDHGDIEVILMVPMWTQEKDPFNGHAIRGYGEIPRDSIPQFANLIKKDNRVQPYGVDGATVRLIALSKTRGYNPDNIMVVRFGSDKAAYLYMEIDSQPCRIRFSDEASKFLFEHWSRFDGGE